MRLLVSDPFLLCRVKTLPCLTSFPAIAKNSLSDLWKFANLIIPRQKFGLVNILDLFCIPSKKIRDVTPSFSLNWCSNTKKPSGNFSYGAKPRDCSLTSAPQRVRTQSPGNRYTDSNICKQENTICISPLFLYSSNCISASANYQLVV